MPGLVPGIHDLPVCEPARTTRMAGSSPAMTGQNGSRLRAPRNDESRRVVLLRLAGGLLLVLLPLLLIGAMAAVEAAGGGAEHAVMPGEMAGDATDRGALQAALGIGGSRCRKRKHRSSGKN